MNSKQVKNIIVLKDLPSNLIEEAFVILKNNKKIKLLETVDKKEGIADTKEASNDYIIKEAEMVISSYFSKIEEDKKIRSSYMRKMENRYRKLKKVTAVLTGIILINTIIQILGM